MGYKTSKTIGHSAVSDSDVHDETSSDNFSDEDCEDSFDDTNKTKKSNDGNEINVDQINDSDSDVDGNSLIDNEALEVTDETESESCDEDDHLQLLAFEGGSCIPKQKVKPFSTIEHSKIKGYKFTSYSDNSDTESDDSFVVSDDYVEYDSTADNLSIIEENIGKRKKKYKRVILSESSTAEDSACEIVDTDFEKTKQRVEQQCIQTLTLSPKVASKSQIDKQNNENNTISENKNCSKINNKKCKKRILNESNFVVTTINDRREYPGEQQSHLLVKKKYSNFVVTTINDRKECPGEQQSHDSHQFMVKKNNSNFVVTTIKKKEYPSEQDLHKIVLKKTSGKRKRRISGEENMRKKQKTV